VLYKIAEIPFGSVRTYGDIAKLIDRPGCARAVGQVMHRNPLPVIFPCHRVVASNGLGGFNGGLKLKRFLLEKEGNFTF
jgi:methylated-DNA-[protein]-cysteine S-methyltransferase